MRTSAYNDDGIVFGELFSAPCDWKRPNSSSCERRRGRGIFLRLLTFSKSISAFYDFSERRHEYLGVQKVIWIRFLKSGERLDSHEYRLRARYRSQRFFDL